MKLRRKEVWSVSVRKITLASPGCSQCVHCNWCPRRTAGLSFFRVRHADDFTLEPLGPPGGSPKLLVDDSAEQLVRCLHCTVHVWCRPVQLERLLLGPQLDLPQVGCCVSLVRVQTTGREDRGHDLGDGPPPWGWLFGYKDQETREWGVGKELGMLFNEY